MSVRCDFAAHGHVRQGDLHSALYTCNPAVSVSAAIELPSAAELARHDAKRPVEPGEPQYLIGGVSLMTNLHAQIVAAMEDHGITWTQIADSLGRPSRQALVASTKRRLVYAPRLNEICRLIGIDPKVLIEREYSFEEALRLGLPHNPN